jgi:hypothetical protein
LRAERGKPRGVLVQTVAFSCSISTCPGASTVGEFPSGLVRDRRSIRALSVRAAGKRFGWTISIGRREQLVPGGRAEAVFSVRRETWDHASMSSAMWECEDRGLDFDSDACGELMDAAPSFEDTTETMFVCAELGGRWCCRSFGRSVPSDEEIREHVCGE